MIEVSGLTKTFDGFVAVDDLNLCIRDSAVFGLVGTNGAGKSTFLKMAAGIMKPDSGSVRIDGTDVYENTEVKQNLFYISDDQYFFENAKPREMTNLYRLVYPDFDIHRFDMLIDSFELPKDRKINTYSKGWKTNRLPKVNLAILRLAIYEIKYVDDVPASVAINEAVELAKKYSGEGDYSFINGILGSVAKGEK